MSKNDEDKALSRRNLIITSIVGITVILAFLIKLPRELLETMRLLRTTETPMLTSTLEPAVTFTPASTNNALPTAVSTLEPAIAPSPIPPTLTTIAILPTTNSPTSIPTPMLCQIPTATHKLLLSNHNSFFWIDARRECATAYSGDRPADCNNILGGDADGSILLGTFNGAEIMMYSVESNDTPVDIGNYRERPAWAIKFFWKVPPGIFENRNGHFLEAPNPTWLVLNEPNTGNSTQPSTTVSFLQGIKDAQFQQECSAEDYEIISVIGYLNDPDLHLIVEKLR